MNLLQVMTPPQGKKPVQISGGMWIKSCFDGGPPGSRWDFQTLHSFRGKFSVIRWSSWSTITMLTSNSEEENQEVTLQKCHRFLQDNRRTEILIPQSHVWNSRPMSVQNNYIHYFLRDVYGAYLRYVSQFHYLHDSNCYSIFAAM